MGSKRKEEIQTVIVVVGGGGREKGASSLNLDLWGLVGGISECAYINYSGYVWS